jgi:protein-S-isoprenylcysteine O-methyltransferase Ste14
MTIARAVAAGVGALAVLDAVLLVVRQRKGTIEYPRYGGPGALAVHASVVALFGITMIVVVLAGTGAIPISAVAATFVVLGVLDLLVGYLARRRLRSSKVDGGRG